MPSLRAFQLPITQTTHCSTNKQQRPFCLKAEKPHTGLQLQCMASNSLHWNYYRKHQ